MKKLERIFLYSILTILVFYVFFVDGNVESKADIQDEIRARSIVIVNDAGQGVVKLWVYEGGGGITVHNKDGNIVASMRAISSGGGMTFLNKAGNVVADIGSCKYGGEVVVCNNHGEVISSLP